MPQGRPKPPRPPGPPPRDPRPGEGEISPIVLATLAIGIYFATLWFGITIVGDTAGRSALMAGLILGLFGAFYIHNQRIKPKGPNRK